MKKVLTNFAAFVSVIVMLDLMILFTGLAQVAIEGRTGYWNPFWRWQAQQVVKVLVALK